MSTYRSGYLSLLSVPLNPLSFPAKKLAVPDDQFGFHDHGFKTVMDLSCWLLM